MASRHGGADPGRCPRAAETAAIALIGTTVAAGIAALLCVPAARNLTPRLLARLPARLLLNALRGVDSFVFALLFVAAVGLGPFAGMLGIAMHSAGSIGKLFAETIEGLPAGPLEAAELDRGQPAQDRRLHPGTRRPARARLGGAVHA